MVTPPRFPEDVVHSDPERLGGTPVFVGSRVPVQSLFDYLEAGDSLDEFLHQFPSVRDLPELDAQNVIGVGWAGLINGALLRQAAGQIDVLVTMDKNLQFQQILAAVAESAPGTIRVVGP